MGENKRFYWIKLKTDFFNQDTIDFLLSQENGCEYIVLYQMLCLNTANNDGRLSSNIGEMIVPYDVKKIVRDTKYFTFDTVTIALGLFKQLGLIYEEEDKVLRINNFDEMVGSETSKAAIMRRKRAREKELNGGNIVTKMLPECYVEIEKEKEIDKEIDIDKKKDIKNKTYYDNYELNSLFLEFLEVRKKLKAVNSERAINTLLKTLSEYDDDTKYKMIENSIVNSWKSVYPLKDNKQNVSDNYKRKEIVPDWINKDIKDEPLEDKELNEFINEFNPSFEERRAVLQEKLKRKYSKKGGVI